MTTNIVDFHPREEAELIIPSRIYFGFNREDQVVTITFCGEEDGAEIGFVLQAEDLLLVEEQISRMKKLAGL